MRSARHPLSTHSSLARKRPSEGVLVEDPLLIADDEAHQWEADDEQPATPSRGRGDVGGGTSAWTRATADGKALPPRGSWTSAGRYRNNCVGGCAADQIERLRRGAAYRQSSQRSRPTI